MKRIGWLSFFLLVFCGINAQHSDCVSAIEICSRGTYELPSVSGAGEDQTEIPSTCGSSFVLPDNAEHNSTWVRWQVETDEVLEFELIPNNPGDDLDFIVLKLTDGCAEKEVIRY